MKMPKVIYVRQEVDGETEYLIACEDIEDVVENDGVTIVGAYELTHTTKMKKSVVRVA